MQRTKNRQGIIEKLDGRAYFTKYQDLRNYSNEVGWHWGNNE